MSNIRFSTNKRKLKKIWESLFSIENDQKNKSDNYSKQIEKILKDPNQIFFKNPLNISDVKKVNVVPTLISDTKAVTANIDLPSKASYNTSFRIEVPEQFIPYLEFTTKILPLPGTRVENILKYQTSEFSGDNIEVKGDGTLVYKGDPVVDRRQIFTEDQLNDIGVSLTHTKPVWRFFLNGAPSGGTISSISWQKTVGTVTTTFNTNFILGGEHKITNMSSTSFTAIGDETIDDTDNPPAVTSTNITRTKSFADADSYSITTVSVNGFGDDVTVTTLSTAITSQDFVEDGVWLYWDIDTINLFSTKDTGTLDGDFTVIEIVPGFAATGQNVGHAPYDTITYTRNKVQEPETIDTETKFAFTKKDKNQFFRISKEKNNNDKEIFVPTYLIEVKGEFLIVGKNNGSLADTQDFPVYDDEFTKNMSDEYDEDEDHAILSKTLYAPKLEDVPIEIQVSFLHPLYWKENRKYNKNDF